MNPELLRSFQTFVSRTLVSWMCVSVAVTFATSSKAAGEALSTYNPGLTLATALDPREPVIADFNRDGTPDMAVVCGTGFVSIFLGTGNGTFGPRADFSALVQRNPAESDIPASLEVADLNNDGRDDLITANFNSFVLPPGSVSVLLGNGDGTFRPSQQFPVGDGPVSARAVDMNGDGQLDVVATNYRSNTVTVLLGNGDGTLQPAHDFPTGENPRDLALGDFNEDGFPDVLVADSGSNPFQTCSLMLGNGDGTLQPRTTIFAAAQGIAVGRLNGDSHLDLVACTFGFNTAQVFLGSGDGTLTSAGSLNLAMSSFDLKLADLNLDGTQDVVALGQQGDTPQTVSIFLNHGDATFEPRSEFTIGREPTGMAVGRLDSDQLPDIVIADRRTHTVSLWQTTPSSADRPPFVTAPTVVSGTEGQRMTIDVTASDPDATPIASLVATQLPPGATFTTNAGHTSGTLDWTPDFTQGGVYTVVFTATANTLTDIAVTSIFIANQNGAPVAAAGGPYSGIAGSPVNFDGSASSDPDGDALSYAWSFGDGATGAGVTPMHTYNAGGSFAVSLRVADPGGLHGDAATTATIQSVVSADILLENGGSTLDVRKMGNRSTTVGLEETLLPYTDLIPSSIRISTAFPNSGFVTDCPPDLRSFVMGDLNGNGVPDIDVRFSNKCLANLFNNVPDNTVATVVITGQFSEPGGMVPVNAQRDLTIRAKHRDEQIMAVASPNPFNPETAIEYTVMKAGSVTIRIYSIGGRLVRTLKQGEPTEPGTYDVMWNGTDDSGGHVSSGIYLLRTTQKAGAIEESSVLKLILTK